MQYLIQGYVEVNLRIPLIAEFNEDILSMLIHDRKFENKVPIQIGTGVIDKEMRLIAKEEFDRAVDAWEQTHVSVSHTKANKVSKDGFQL